jgi:precorrin-6B methylase 2
MTPNNQNQKNIIPPVPVMNLVNGLHRFFYKLAKRLIPPQVWMMNQAENLWLSRGVVIALHLNIAEHIRDGRNTIDQLAAATQTNPDALYRLMRMLCAHEIFRLSKKGIYTLTPWSKVLLEGDKDSVKDFLLGHLGKLHYELFSEMDYTVKTGINAAQKLFNKDIFSHVHDTPEEQEIFIRGMSNTAELFAPVLLSAYSFTPYRHIVDIGGGHGSLLCHVLTKHETLQATLFDSDHVIGRATANIASYGLTDRIKIVVGDFFGSVPEGADLYIMKHILHDWNDGDSIKILRNINKAMQPGAKLLVIETILKNNNNYSFGKMLDILMLVITKDGRERTLDEFRHIFSESGFAIKRVIPTITPFSLIECIKLN